MKQFKREWKIMAQFLCLQAIIELLSSACHARHRFLSDLLSQDSFPFLLFRCAAENFSARLAAEQAQWRGGKGREKFFN